MSVQRIVALGGGGFSMEPRNPRLDKWLLSLARRRRPRVLFVPTASGDSKDYIRKFYLAFQRHECTPTHLELFKRTAEDPRKAILGSDLVYVGGGNTANLLAVWLTHGLEHLLRQASHQGAVLCGISAGALCWFECGITDSFGPTLKALHDGLGFLGGSFCPHYHGEPQRRPTYHRLIQQGFPAGHGADDGCALHFTGGRLVGAVSSLPKARAYRVELHNGAVREMPLQPQFPGAAVTESDDDRSLNALMASVVGRRLLSALADGFFEQPGVADIGLEGDVDRVSDRRNCPGAEVDQQIERHPRLHCLAQLVAIGDPQRVHAGNRPDGIAGNRHQPEQALQPKSNAADLELDIKPLGDVASPPKVRVQISPACRLMAEPCPDLFPDRTEAHKSHATRAQAGFDAGSYKSPAAFERYCHFTSTTPGCCARAAMTSCGSRSSSLT